MSVIWQFYFILSISSRLKPPKWCKKSHSKATKTKYNRFGRVTKCFYWPNNDIMYPLVWTHLYGFSPLNLVYYPASDHINGTRNHILQTLRTKCNGFGWVTKWLYWQNNDINVPIGHNSFIWLYPFNFEILPPTKTSFVQEFTFYGP